MASGHPGFVARVWKRLRATASLERVAAAAALAIMLAVRIADPNVVQLARVKFFDLYLSLQPSQNTQRPVVIVDIDEKSLKELGQWPWPRTRLAELLRRLRAAGTPAVAFDVMFPEPDRTSPDVFAREATLPAALKAELLKLPDNDKAFATAMGGIAVVLGEAILPTAPSGKNGRGKTPPVAILGPSPLPFLIQAPGILHNVRALENAAAGTGLLTHYPEFDGVVRRLPAAYGHGDKILLPLALELLRVATGGGTAVIKSDADGIAGIILAGQLIPTDAGGRIWINFSYHDPARYVSAVDVIKGRVPAARLRGRLAIVGASAAGLLDIKATPLQRSVPGVEMHAMVLENILFKDYIQRPAYADAAEFYVTVILSLLMIVFLPLLGPMKTMLAGMAVLAALFGAAFYAFLELKLLIDVTFAAITVTFVFMVLAGFNYLRESQSKDNIRRAFSRYMSPALVEQLADRPDRLVLGGELRELSVLFTDIRGFTKISETMDAQTLTRFINRFLTPISNVILEHGGTIDKYIGDSVMAFWNAPLELPDHAERACRAALAMRAALVDFNQAMQQEGQLPPIRIGIGINTGPCSVGNMGSDMRFDYSALGDEVNLASRLEGATKEFGVDIIIGGKTEAQVQTFAYLELGEIVIRGREARTRAYALIGDEAVAQSDDFRAWQTAHRAVLAEADPAPLADRVARARALSGGRLKEYYDSVEAEGAFRTVDQQGDRTAYGISLEDRAAV